MNMHRQPGCMETYFMYRHAQTDTFTHTHTHTLLLCKQNPSPPFHIFPACRNTHNYVKPGAAVIIGQSMYPGSFIQTHTTQPFRHTHTHTHTLSHWCLNTKSLTHKVNQDSTCFCCTSKIILYPSDTTILNALFYAHTLSLTSLRYTHTHTHTHTPSHTQIHRDINTSTWTHSRWWLSWQSTGITVLISVLVSVVSIRHRKV